MHLQYLILFIIFGSFAALFATGAETPRVDDILEAAKPIPGVEVLEKIGKPVADSFFVDEDGKKKKLSEYYFLKKPVILVPVYYNCTNLCPILLNGLVFLSEKEKSLQLGRDYSILTYSINPDEKPDIATVKKKQYLEKYISSSEQNQIALGFKFLTSDITAIGELSTSIGYRYLQESKSTMNKKYRDFIHPSVLIILTPDGIVSRYLYISLLSQKDFKLALLEAGGGIGSFTDKIIMYCHEFDNTKHKYAIIPWHIMQLGGGGAGLALILFLLFMWARRKLIQ